MFGRSSKSDETKPAKTVLLVEDQTPVRALLTTALSRRGYRVLAAQDGSDALAQAVACEEPIDLLLTDMVMPAMSGAALTERLVELRPETRVLYTSGQADRATQLELGRRAKEIFGVKGETLEPDDFFLSKPFGVEELVTKVDFLFSVVEDDLERPSPQRQPLDGDDLPPRPSFAAFRSFKPAN